MEDKPLEIKLVIIGNGRVGRSVLLLRYPIGSRSPLLGRVRDAIAQHTSDDEPLLIGTEKRVSSPIIGDDKLLLIGTEKRNSSPEPYPVVSRREKRQRCQQLRPPKNQRRPQQRHTHRR